MGQTSITEKLAQDFVENGGQLFSKLDDGDREQIVRAYLGETDELLEALYPERTKILQLLYWGDHVRAGDVAKAACDTYCQGPIQTILDDASERFIERMADAARFGEVGLEL